MSGVRGEPFMLRTAFRIQPKCYRDSLEKGGLPRAVLSNEERHRCFEPQFGKMANGGHGIRIISWLWTERTHSGDGLDEDARDGGCQFGTTLLHFRGGAGVIQGDGEVEIPLSMNLLGRPNGCRSRGLTTRA